MPYSQWIFYSVFVSQILLTSYYFPSRLLERMTYVLENYPASEYPKLYPESEEYYRLAHGIFRWVNRIILLLGVGILVAIHRLGAGSEGAISEAWPAAYAMIQVLPLIALEIAAFRLFRLMRQSGAARIRKAVLRRRRFFDLVSPALLILAVLLWVGTLAFDTVLHGVFRWEQALWLTFGNLFMVSIGLWQLYGRKQDPHQAADDRDRLLTAQWTSLLGVSIVMSLFFMFHSADQLFELDFLDAPLMSVYFQVILVLSLGLQMRSIRVEDIDFEVYRGDPAVS
jgi:hypothetical protein